MAQVSLAEVQSDLRQCLHNEHVQSQVIQRFRAGSTRQTLEERLFVSICVRVDYDQSRNTRQEILLWARASHRQFLSALVYKKIFSLRHLLFQKSL